ncbi:VOC family protein [Ornithinimicrobium avium]|uniref:VOC family protein n=1 Tax=Ornithinimicrobium avium TaxID=2283195 RepID=A0A345NR44_9MICO|nr:VOC family protein [Ornithinimicrobium avium]AXH97502.1 VOC family protein [Ornithinimicrobium avium]
MRRPRIEATSVSISTDRPRELARFYADLLGVAVHAEEGPRPGEPPGAGWAQLRRSEGHLRMTVNLEYDPHYEKPTWPSEPAAQQPQAHLDLWVDDLDAAEAWAVELGARRHGVQPQETVRVMLDPHGHPFCLFTS